MTEEDLTTILRLVKETGKLKNVFRSGWLDAGVSPSDVESVADHSFRVAFISMIVSDYIVKENHDLKIDIEKIIRMALLHDLAETKIGDLHLTATEYIGKENKKHAEIKAFEDLVRTIDPQIKSYYIEIFKEYVAEETVEAKIVRCADVIDMLLQAEYYRDVGYPRDILKEFWHLEEYVKLCNLPVLEKLLTLIVKMWKEKE